MIDGSILDGKITFWTVNFSKSRKQPHAVNTGNEEDLSLALCLGQLPCAGCIYMGQFKCCVVHITQVQYKQDINTVTLLLLAVLLKQQIQTPLTVIFAFGYKAVLDSKSPPDMSHVFCQPFCFVNTNRLSCCVMPITKAFAITKYPHRYRHGILGALQSFTAQQ